MGGRFPVTGQGTGGSSGSRRRERTRKGLGARPGRGLEERTGGSLRWEQRKEDAPEALRGKN